MKKSISAKIVNFGLTPANGIDVKSQNEDSLRLTLKITSGPDAFLDPKVSVDILASEIASEIPALFSINLYNELVKMKVDRMAAAFEV